MNFFEQYDGRLDRAELALVDRARGFCEGVFSEQVCEAYLRCDPFPREWIGRWAAEGMLGLQVRADHGGHGASFLCKVRVAQEMARHGFAAAFCLNNLQGQATRISRAGSEEQRNRLLPGLMDGTILSAPSISEPGAGSDLGSLETRARKVDGGWLVDGTKSWITNGTIVDYLTMLVRSDDASGMTTLLVECGAARTIVREEIPLPGARSFRLAKIAFHGHFVPDWAMLGAPGDAVRSAMAAVNAARVHVAAICVATLHAALCDAVRYGGTRTAFGRKLLDHQGLQWELAEVAIRLEAANALVFKAACLVDRGAPAVTAAAQCKKFAVDTATWGVERCIRAMGAVGASGAHRLAMQLAELRLSAFADGTGEMMLDRVGRSLPKDYGAVGEGGTGGRAA